MTTTAFVDGSTLSAAAWANDTDTLTYNRLTTPAGTNTVTATGPASMTAYAAGQIFTFIPANTNTGATTLNITPSGGSALGAKNIFATNAACVGGEIRQNVPVMVWYDGTQFQIIGNGAFANIAAVPDNLFAIQDNGDRTKQGAFQLSGVDTGTTRTLTWPNQAGTIAVTTDITGGTLAGSFTTLAASGAGTSTAANAFAWNQTVASGQSGGYQVNDGIKFWRIIHTTGDLFQVGTSSNHPWDLMANGTVALTLTGANGQFAGTLGVTGVTTLSANAIINSAGAGVSGIAVTQSNNSALLTGLFTSSAATSTNQYGIRIDLAGDPNNTSNYFAQGQGTATERWTLRSNGGLANYSANDVNLSDATTKTGFELLNTASVWDAHKAMRDVWCLFEYKDQTHRDKNMGYTAQGVAKAWAGVAPWLTETDKDGRMWVYDNDLSHFTGAIVTELQFRSDDHESQIQSLTARLGKAESALSRITMEK